MRLRTKTRPAFYIHELRGVCYISWASEEDKSEALNFPSTKIDKWQETLSVITGFELEIDNSLEEEEHPTF